MNWMSMRNKSFRCFLENNSYDKDEIKFMDSPVSEFKWAFPSDDLYRRYQEWCLANWDTEKDELMDLEAEIKAQCCRNCRLRLDFDLRYGDMTKVKRFVICSFRPKQKLFPNSRPKWCPKLIELNKQVGHTPIEYTESRCE